MPPRPRRPRAVRTFSRDGVDLTLIRWMLSLSPLERLRTLQRNAEAAGRLRALVRSR